MGEPVDILMAVYNGERFVREQVESILRQTHEDLILIIQDDCSTDNTIALLEPYTRKYPGKVVLKQRTENSGTAFKNFFSMLPYAQNRYVMFSDHDDVWMPDKVERTLRAMKKLEQDGAGRPLLVHTDLTVTDEGLHTQAPSMIRRQRLNPNASFEQLLVQNAITGCTMMVNRALLAMVNKPPERVIMHDWWFALIAAAFGEIGYVEQPTILYRQHGGNQVGAKDVSSLRYNAERLRDQTGARQVLYDTCCQAGAFLQEYGDRLDQTKRELLASYRDLPEKPKIRRVSTLCRYRLWKRGLLRKLGQLAFI